MSWQQRSLILGALRDEQLASLKAQLLGLVADGERIDPELRLVRMRELGECLVETSMRKAERRHAH
jgi:hypothetical protein